MSPEAKSFIQSLLCFDPSQRLGANGAEEVKQHPFLRGIDWANLRTEEANFVPQIGDPESTDYFDARGAVDQVFEDDTSNADAAERPSSAGSKENLDPEGSVDAQQIQRERAETAPNDFGSFVFKNLDVLKQANDDVIKKLRSDQLLRSPSEAPMRTRLDNLGRRNKPKNNSGVDNKVRQICCSSQSPY